jgi:hypothetical protein
MITLPGKSITTTFLEPLCRDFPGPALREQQIMEFPLSSSSFKLKRGARMQQMADLRGDPVEEICYLFGQAPMALGIFQLSQF